MIDIDNYKLPNKTVKKMRDRIDDTRQTELEHTFLLCLDKENIIRDRVHSRGKAGSVRHYSNECPKSEKYVGNYHTHHGEEDIMSPQDFLSTCKDKVSCIGSDSTEDITCFTRKVHPVKSHDRNSRRECEKDIMPIIKTPVVTWASYQRMDELSEKYFDKTKILKDYELDDESDGANEEFELVEVQD